jgi:hypothetical protein
MHVGTGLDERYRVEFFSGILFQQHILPSFEENIIRLKRGSIMRVKMFLPLLCLSALLLIGLPAMSPPSQAFDVEATIDIEPNTLNLKMRSRWITAYIDLPEGYNVTDIDPMTIVLEGSVGIEWCNIQGEVLMVKFNASRAIDLLWDMWYHFGTKQAQISLTIEGQLNDGTHFAGTDTIKIINPSDY